MVGQKNAACQKREFGGNLFFSRMTRNEMRELLFMCIASSAASKEDVRQLYNDFKIYEIDRSRMQKRLRQICTKQELKMGLIKFHHCLRALCGVDGPKTSRAFNSLPKNSRALSKVRT